MEALFLRVLTLSLTASAVLLPLLAMAPWLRRRYAGRAFYVLWLLLALRLLLPFQLPLPGAAVTVRLPPAEALLPSAAARPAAEAADAPPSAPAGEPLAAETEAGTARSWTELGGIAQVSFQDEPAEETTGRATLLGAREGCYVYSYGYQAPLPDLQQAPEAVREQYDTLYDAFRGGLILTFTDTTGG